jgi:hypothetical protein
MSLTPRTDKTDFNAFINGGFDYFQRGTSVGSVSATDYYAPDRFALESSPNAVASRVVDSPNSLTKYALNMTVTPSSGGSLIRIRQRVEDKVAQKLVGSAVSIRASYKCSNFSEVFLLVRTFQNPNDNVNVTTQISETTAITNNSTWQIFKRENWVVPAEAVNGFEVIWTFQTPDSIGVLENFRFTQAKVGFGATAQDFSYFAGDSVSELNTCLRYYEKSYGIDTTPGTVTSEYVYLLGAGNGGQMIMSPVYIKEKRTGNYAVYFYRYDIPNSTPSGRWVIYPFGGGASTVGMAVISKSTKQFSPYGTDAGVLNTHYELYGAWAVDDEI